MKSVAIALVLVFSSAARAEFLQMKQSVFGMD